MACGLDLARQVFLSGPGGVAPWVVAHWRSPTVP